MIGGLAGNLHGLARSTFDLDLLIQSNEANARRLLDSLQDAGIQTAREISAKGLLGNEITIFQDYVRIDVQTLTPGIEFEQAWIDKLIVFFGDIELFVLSKRDLIASKRAAGREIDLEDVKILEGGPP